MDPYVYSGTNVLRNLRDIRDPEVLRAFEADATSRRIRQLEHKPLAGNLNAERLKAIHRHIFQDVYAWAGEFRTVNIARGGQFPFAFTEQLVPALEKTFDDLRDERFLERLDPDRFSNRGAYYLGELNAIHPFREGNGRTQREFIRQLALRSSHVIEWARVNRQDMDEASRRSFETGSYAGLEKVIRASLAPDRLRGSGPDR